MDEYNINNIEKINSINFININNENYNQDPAAQIYNKIKYIKTFNKLNSYSTNKTKKIIPKNNNNAKDYLLLENELMEQKLMKKNSNKDNIFSDNDDMDLTEMRLNSKKYQGLRKNIVGNNINSNILTNKSNIILNNKQQMEQDNYTYNQLQIKKMKPKIKITDFKGGHSNININNIKRDSLLNSKMTIHRNDNNNYNSFTDCSYNENNTSQNTKNNLCFKKIDEYKKNNKQLMEKLKIFAKNLKLKSNEIQILKQKNQSLQNELYSIKINNEKNKNNVKINNNEELKKILMQKNKMINDAYQKLQIMKKDIDNKNIKNSNLSNALTKKNLELVEHQKELIEKEKKIEELMLALNQEKLNTDKTNENINLKNDELKQENYEKEKQIETLSKKINDLEIDLKGVKADEKEYFYKNKKNEEIIEKKDKEIKDLKHQISLNNNKNNLINKEDINNKESEILFKRIEDLTNENNKLTKHINTLSSLRNSLNTKNELISPNNYTIITNKYHNKLLWYLLLKKSSTQDIDNYDNYIWVKEPEIKKDLKNFNKFKEEKDEIKELKDFNLNLQKKLELKEEKINKLDYTNQKLSSQLHNKTANIKENKENILLAKQSKDNSNFVNSFNTEAAENERKYKNILDKLNDSNKRNIHLQNQVTILKEKLNEKDNLEKNFPNDLKDIDPKLHDSGFLDDDSFENKKEDINDLLKIDQENNIINNNNKIKNETSKEINLSNNENNDDLNKAINNINSKNDDPFKESEKLVDEFLAKGAGEEDDFDEVKMINKQMNFLKEEIKDYREKNKKLGNEIKELFSKIKCNSKNKNHIVQICQLLGFQPTIVEQIISNKFKIEKTNK